MRFDSKIRKIFKQEKHWPSLQIPDRNDINSSRHFWGQYNGPLRRKTNSFFNQLGGRDGQMMNQWTEDNMVQRKIISEWAHSDQLRAMMFKNNLWSSKPRQQLRAKMYLKDIFISSSWFIISNMAMTIERCYHMNCFEWMLGGCTAPT